MTDRKLKTKKAVFKRVKITKSKICRKKAYKSHLLRKKSPRQLRLLSIFSSVQKSDQKNFYSMIPYQY